jgi:hypothetical protein
MDASRAGSRLGISDFVPGSRVMLQSTGPEVVVCDIVVENGIEKTAVGSCTQTNSSAVRMWLPSCHLDT